MIFDLNDNPANDNEYQQQRLLSMVILLVKAAGGQIVLTRQTREDLGAQRSKQFLEQQRTAEGDWVFTVGERP